MLVVLVVLIVAVFAVTFVLVVLSWLPFTASVLVALSVPAATLVTRRFSALP